MDRQLLREFMTVDIIPARVKFDDYLSVALGVRRASQVVFPAELPDAMILGATIDDRFQQKMRGGRLPGESLSQFFKGKIGKYWRRSEIQEIRYRTEVLRDLYEDVVVRSHSYGVFISWMDRLGLKRKELESRPTIREMYLFTDPSVLDELEELQDMRKDIRYNQMKVADPSVPAYARAFPEERDSGYLKKLGTLLGFPQCCIDRYIFDRESGVLTPESRASNQLLSLENPDECNPFSYFAKDFFPCQPDCPQAAAIGKKMYEALLELDQDVAREYRKHLDENIELVRNYPEIIRKKIELLEQISGKSREGGKVDG